MNFRPMNKWLHYFLIGFTLVVGFVACADKSSKEQKAKNASPKVAQTGEQIYTTYCVICHGEDGKLGVNGAKDLSQSLMSMEEKKQLIANGKGMMAPHKNIITAEEIENVAKYISKFVQY